MSTSSRLFGRRALTGALVASMASTVLATAPASAAMIEGTTAVATAVVDQVLLDDLAELADGERAIVYVHGETYVDAVEALDATTAIFSSNFQEVGVAAAWVTAADVEDLRTAPGVTFLEGEVEVVHHLVSSQRAIRNDLVPAMLDGNPTLDGTGMAVAVLDTGVDGDHPMFLLEGADTPTDPTDDVTKVKRQLAWECGVMPVNLDVDEDGQPVSALAYDISDTCFIDHTKVGGFKNDTTNNGGHGTHVASTAAGLPMTTSDGLLLQGVAPGATILDLSVQQGATFLGANNGLAYVLRHQRSWCDPAAGPYQDAGCDPIVATNHSYGPQGGSSYSPDSIANKLARALIDTGITIAWSAGNDGGDGSGAVTNGTPRERQPGIMMVASYDDGGIGSREGTVSTFSSRGASTDPGSWPDISAPGTNITAACRATLADCRGLGPVTAESEDLDAGTISGTSMAAPHVAGAIAVVQQAALATSGSFLAPADVERLFKETAVPFTHGVDYTEPTDSFRPDNFGVPHAFDKGAGLLDLAAAVSTVLNGASNVDAVLTVDEPVDGSVTGESTVTVSGTVDNTPADFRRSDDVVASFVDADDDATSAYTEILDATFEVTATEIIATVHVEEVWPTPDFLSGVSYHLLVDGRDLESFMYGPGGVRIFDGGASRYTNDDEVRATWDVETGTVTFFANRAYLAGEGDVRDNYYLAVTANNGGVGISSVDDRVPNAGGVIDLAGPELHVAAPDLALDGSNATTVTFEHDGVYGNRFYTEDSTLGFFEGVIPISQGTHGFTLDLPGKRDVTFRLDWTDVTDASDLDLYVTGNGVDSGSEGATASLGEVVTLTDVEGTLTIGVEPYLILDGANGTAYTLVAEIESGEPVDTDGDGVLDIDDECPTVAGTAADGCPDSDGDGVSDGKDRCPDVAGTGADGCPVVATEFVRISEGGVELAVQPVDTSLGTDDYALDVELGVGTHQLLVEWLVDGFAVDAQTVTVTYFPDADGDGVRDDLDVCDGFDDNLDNDGDGAPDGCDADDDNDGVDDADDNCAMKPNVDQADLDGDGIGDACDADLDGDGHANGKERAFGTDEYDPTSFPTKGETA